MVGKSTFHDFYTQMNKQANELSNSEENQNKRNRGMRR
jgi:hypothetical protein